MLRKLALPIGSACALFMLTTGVGHTAPPDYYPADYSKIIEGSKSESGLLVYSNVSFPNWDPIIKAFNQEYPWIKVETTDMRANEVFERYYTDQAGGVKSADMLLAAAPLNWLDYLSKYKPLQYDSPEKSHLPDWSMPAPSVYAISTDPFFIAYNKLLLPEDKWPKTLQDVANLVKANPDDYKDRIGTQHPNTSTYSQGIYWSLVNRDADKAYDWFKTLGPITTTYRSANQALEKIASGEYLLAYFTNMGGLTPYINDPAAATLMGWTFPSDAAVVYLRTFAIAQTTKSPNSAKLLLDFILSRKGQTAVGQGGLMPYRSDVDDPSAFRLAGLSYDALVNKVGKDNIIMIDFNPAIGPGIDKVSKLLEDSFKKAQ